MQEENIGLANSVINGVTKVIQRHGRVIVLEDDIVTSPYFLSFMNNALNYYINQRNVFSVTGFNHSPIDNENSQILSARCVFKPKSIFLGLGNMERPMGNSRLGC